MVPAGYAVVVALCLGIAGIGLLYVTRPQLMFRVYNGPTGGSGDHLTADGVRAYKRRGLVVVLLGAFALVMFLVVSS